MSRFWAAWLLLPALAVAQRPAGAPPPREDAMVVAVAREATVLEGGIKSFRIFGVKDGKLVVFFAGGGSTC